MKGEHFTISNCVFNFSFLALVLYEILGGSVAVPLFRQTDIWQLFILGCIRKHNMNKNIKLLSLVNCQDCCVIVGIVFSPHGACCKLLHW